MTTFFYFSGENKLMTTALITGAAKRLGKAMALAMAKQGYNIIIHCKSSKEEAMALQQEIEQMGRSAWVVSADLSAADLSVFFEEIKSLNQTISLLVNSASVFIPSTFEDSDVDQLDLHWQVNCRAPYLLTQWFVKQYDSGHIVNITDCVEHNTNYFPYMLSKNAFSSLSTMLAKQLAPQFRVNSIAPGWILNPPTEEQHFDETKVRESIPVKSKGDVQDICQALLYLDNNPYIVGQTIYVDGGRHL
jgi:pteridine reductase